MPLSKLIHVGVASLLILLGTKPLLAQEDSSPKYYIGLSYGTSFSLGDFADTDITNSDAGFAKNGQKIDLFGGAFLKEQVVLTANFRYQTFETEVEAIINRFKEDNPGVEFAGSTENWETYSFLIGVAYRVQVGRRLTFYPRLGLGPLFVSNPGIQVNSPNTAINNNFERSSETGAGLGYEVGIGFQKNLGKRFTLLPTFTFSGGRVNINDVVTTTDNIRAVSDYKPVISSFNLGLSLGYKFY